MKLEIENDGKFVTIYCTKDGKVQQLPREQIPVDQFETPNQNSIEYWFHYGFDRTQFKLPEEN